MKTVFKFFLIWVAFWTLEYWIFGPYSYIRFYDEADMGVSKLLYLANHYMGGSFLHAIQGGGDYYASFERGAEYINLEQLLYGTFPLWVAHCIHKLSLVVVSFSGAYLLLKRVTKIEAFYAFSLAAFVSVYNPYILYSTVQHGIGYAFLSLAIYVYVFLVKEKYYLVYASLLSVLIAISSNPTKSFPIMLFGVFIFALFFLREKYAKFFLGLCILVALEVTNSSEVLYGFFIYGLESTRALYGSIRPNFFEALLGGLQFFLGKTDYIIAGHSIYPAMTLSILTFAVAFYLRVSAAKRMFFMSAIFLEFSAILYLIPWEKIGLTFLYSINFFRLSYCLVIPVCLLVGYIMQSNRKYGQSLAALFLITAIFVQLQQKKTALSGIVNGENQQKLMAIPNLVQKDWEPEEPFRVVTAFPYYGVHPNFLWAYGLDTMDGETNLISRELGDFWRYGVHRQPFDEAMNRKFATGSVDLNYAIEESPYGKRMDVGVLKVADLDSFVDLNLLRLANVSHIISYIPLRGHDLIKVSGPDDQNYVSIWDRTLPKTTKIKMGAANLFHVPPVFIYEIKNYSQRAFFPSHLYSLDAQKNSTELYKYISAHYQKNAVFTENKNLQVGRGLVQSVGKIENGYRVKLSVAKPGLFVLNTLPMKFWKAYIDGLPVDSFSVNLVNLGVNVGIGEHTITYKYERPLLRDKILAILGLKKDKKEILTVN